MKTGHEEIDSLFREDFVIEKVEECNEDGIRIYIDARFLDQVFWFEFLRKEEDFVLVADSDLEIYLYCDDCSMYRIALNQLMHRCRDTAMGKK